MKRLERKHVVLSAVACACAVMPACTCNGPKPQQGNLLKPVQPDAGTKKGLGAALPTGIENPANEAQKPNDKPPITKEATEPDQGAVRNGKRTEAVSSARNDRLQARTAGYEKPRAKKIHIEADNSRAVVEAPVTVEQKGRAKAKEPTQVVVPNTRNVRAEVPAGLQQLLNEDPRMQPWVNKVMQVAEQCYARERGYNPLAKGVITVHVTMHENDRPDASLGSLPPLLAGVIACATGKLSGSRMPFFTGNAGNEGAKYTVRMHFTQ